jgi:D-serine deaminase-like pyridoxal phosphate-dependent protein
MNKHDIDTPALLVDSAVLGRNVERMQEVADEFGVRLRPHTKTHKSPHIARLQVEAGAKGVTVAKVGEAEVLAEAGLDDILIANQVIGREKLSRLAELAERVRMAVLVDSRDGVEMLVRAFHGSGSSIDVLVEIDTGKGRCGVIDPAEIAVLADMVVEAPSLRLRGVETHEGHVPGNVTSADTMETRATAAGRKLVEVAEALRSRGHAIEEVSVGSSQATPDECALSVLATVISRPAVDRAVLDAGSKSLFAEPARQAFAYTDYQGFGYIRQAPAARIASLSEEHGVVELPEGTPFPKVGDKVEVIPNHVCPAVNLHEEFYVIDGEDVAEVWPIAARGKVR